MRGEKKSTLQTSPNSKGSEILWQTAVVVVTAFAIRPLYRWLEMPFLRPAARVNPPPA